MSYDNLVSEMAIQGVSIESIAQVLNVHRNTVSNKLKGKGKFTIQEAFVIQSKIFPDKSIDYLFLRENKEQQ